MNTQRNRWLLIALALVAVFYFGDMGYRKLYEVPLQAQQRAKAQLTKQLTEAKRKMAQAKQITDQLAMLDKRSLPANPALARSRYQAWLLQLAGSARLTGTSVDAGDPVAVTYSARRLKKPLLLYNRITFTVHGRGDLTQITRFLYDFYRAGHLHKIRSLSLNPIGEGQIVDMNASIEAISLPTADRDTELSTASADQLAFTDIRPYQLISQRNLFGRGGAHWAWRQVTLTAVTANVDGVGEAWFAFANGDQTEIVPVGQSLSGSVDLTVLRLDGRDVIVAVDGQQYRLSIGHSLAEAKRVADH